MKEALIPVRGIAVDRWYAREAADFTCRVRPVGDMAALLRESLVFTLKSSTSCLGSKRKCGTIEKRKRAEQRKNLTIDSLIASVSQ